MTRSFCPCRRVVENTNISVEVDTGLMFTEFEGRIVEIVDRTPQVGYESGRMIWTIRYWTPDGSLPYEVQVMRDLIESQKVKAFVFTRKLRSSTIRIEDVEDRFLDFVPFEKGD